MKFGDLTNSGKKKKKKKNLRAHLPELETVDEGDKPETPREV